MSDQQILNQVISLEAHFRAGLDAATGLRKRLEGHPSAGLNQKKGLTPEAKAKLLAHRHKSIIKHQKTRS